MVALALIAGCTEVKDLPDADVSQVTRIEPPCWWTGMETPLQLMVQGSGIAAFDVDFQGGGLKVEAVHKADSEDYLFVDVKVSPRTEEGIHYLVFTPSDGSEGGFRYPYLVRRRESRTRESFSTADLVYLIMPDRFANGDPSNDDGFSGSSYDDGSALPWAVPVIAEKSDRSADFGRHGGDLRGQMDHLDYIAGLGATAVWNTPLLLDNQRRASYHGYACGDYYHIDPRFGDNALFREFVDSCHARGLKVIMDVVTNHCGTAHWWMENPPFRDWYHVFPEYTGTNVLFSAYMDPHASQYDRNLQESGWFVPSMPDMNLDNPFVLKYFQQWAVWWAEYSGLDGFRVDTYPYNEPGPMSEWCAAVRREYPWMNIVGECWDPEVCQLAYWQAGANNPDGFNSNLPCIMDFPLRDAMVSALSEDTPGWGEGMTRVYSAISHDFAYADPMNMMVFMANHDHSRMGDVLGGDVSRMKLGIAMLATLRGIPQLFSGDEMMFRASGGRNNDGAKRIDFPGGWDGDAFDLFTPEGRSEAGVDGLYEYSRALFNWRRDCPVLHQGKTIHFMTRDNTYAYFRYDDSSKVFVYINNSTLEHKVPWSRYSEVVSGPAEGVDPVTGVSVTLSDSTLVPAKTALIVELLPTSPK